MNKKQILSDLSEFISIQSVSSDSVRFSQILKAVKFLRQKLHSLGFKVNVLQNGTKPPLVIATRVINKSSKTLGIYGHYDIQPEDPVEEWHYSPFKLTLKNGKMYGRGIADNKGHVIQNIAAIQSLIEQEKLNNNIIFILEGEEESGSVNFETLLKSRLNLLKTIDVQFITDTGMYATNQPQIFYALRGLLYYQLDVLIGNIDLHSGLYGNHTLNPLIVLSELLSAIKKSQNIDILIPKFNDKLRNISTKELSLLKKVERSSATLKKHAQTFRILKIENISSYLLSKIFPSFEIHGISGGYSGEGAKTVIPNKASVKFSFRLVENQEAEECHEIIKKFIKNNLPDGVKYSLRLLGKDGPFYMSLDNDHIRKVAKILTEEFGQECLYNRSGGSIPAAEIMQRLFGKPIILTGFTLPDDNIHAPNENFDEEMFWKGIEVLKKIYGETG